MVYKAESDTGGSTPSEGSFPMQSASSGAVKFKLDVTAVLSTLFAQGAEAEADA